MISTWLFALAISYKGNIVRFTVTIGVAMMDADNIEASIAACDKKLYKGKHGGKNRVVV